VVAAVQGRTDWLHEDESQQRNVLLLGSLSLVSWWSVFLATDPEVWARFLAFTDFPRISGPGTGSTQPREYSRGVNGVICVADK
jgi:hypothetical protein